MGTENGSPHATEARRARRDVDPLQMTEAEKLMAEWEARHDVAARGHRGAPDVLQHYFAHERLTHPTGSRAAVGRVAPEPRQPARAAAAPAPAPKRSRGLLSGLFRRTTQP